MNLSTAKKVFAGLMEKSRSRELRPLEKRTLIRARQVLRQHARPAMNAKRVSMTLAEAKQIVRQYGFTLTKSEGEYRVGTGREESSYYTDDLADAVGTAKHMAQETGLQHERKSNPLKVSPDKYWFEKGFNDAVLKIRKRNRITAYLKGYRAGFEYIHPQVAGKPVSEDYLVDPRMKKRNPQGAVKIYGRCLRIEAIKMVSHVYGGKPARAGQKYWHDFTTKNAIIYGMPDGSLRIVSK